MTESDAMLIVSELMRVYPMQTVTPETLESYAGFLADLDVRATAAAAREHIATSRFFPTIAELRIAVVEAELGLLPTDEAYARVIHTINAVGRNGMWITDLCPVVAEAVRAVGWSAMCMSNAPGVERAAFVKFYEAAKARSIRERNVAPLLESGKVKGLLGG